MARPLRINYPGAFYHVTSRGNERREVFKSRRDREKFLSYLESSSERYGAVIHCWCLMGNHYHLLLETPGGNLPQIMRHINGAYTTYFNVKRQRSGHLFQGPYKSFLVEADSYALELSRYIHLNPVRGGLAARPEAYPWLSYRCYIGNVASPGWLNEKMILGALTADEADARMKYRGFVEVRLGRKDVSPLRAALGGTLLGSASFAERVTRDHIEALRQEAAPQTPRLVAARPTVEQVLAASGRELGPDEKQVRRVALYLSHKLSGLPLGELGNLFGLKETAVCEASRRMRRKLAVDPELAGAVGRIKERVKS